MKENTVHILIKSDGLYVITEMTVEPDRDNYFAGGFFRNNTYEEDVLQFEQALQSAKDSAIKVKNEMEVKQFLEKNHWLKDVGFLFDKDTIYPLQGYKFKPLEMFRCKMCGKHDTIKRECTQMAETCGRVTVKYAIVSPIEVTKLKSIFSKNTSGYETETGSLISAHDYQFLSTSQQERCKPYEIPSIEVKHEIMKTFTKEDLIDLVQHLKDYTRESLNILGFDEREPKEFVDTFLKSKQEVKSVEERKQKQTANKIVLAYVSMNWNHEYAENGIISREDAVKAMEEYASIVTEELNKEIDDLKAKIKALLDG